MITIPITLIDSNNYRDHTGSRSQVLLYDDKIVHEALSNCNHYTDNLIVQNNIDYYIREQYKKEAISGLSVCSGYFKDIAQEYYRISISIIGLNDDIILFFKNRKEAYLVYEQVSEWIFDE